jgi:hypothetical protein
MVAPQQIIKKNKGQGFTYFYIEKTVSFYNICQHMLSLGSVFGIVCKLSVKLKNYCKRKPIWN